MYHFSREKLAYGHCLQPTFRTNVVSANDARRESEWRKQVHTNAWTRFTPDLIRTRELVGLLLNTIMTSQLLL